ncbi:alpha/beta hydrolase [Longispora sp. NPDC051575]|uniref:alpha/beta fold hydrolase n=1 Tax=Longispora sp. NPDC051575 TaxID=3154943 RepID=UPI003415169B
MIGTIVASTVVAAPVVAGLGYRKLRQRAAAKHLAITTPNGIAEERFERIGGVEQWIGIRGENRDNPVLLVLHGGPGSPYSVFGRQLRTWEKHFTVVHWDRRGAGRTLRRNGKAGCGELTFEGMVDEAVEVTEFLRRHLDQDKVILMAGSMGTLIGVPLAQRRPDLFHALVTTDLYANMAANEALSYRGTLERARAAGHTRGVAALERIGADPMAWSLRDWGVKQQWTMKTDPVDPGVLLRLILPSILTTPGYGLGDVQSWMAGFEYSKKQMFDQWMAYDVRAGGTRFEVPFFVFQGEGDVLTLRGLAEEYFAEVDAPLKELALIRDAGHFAAFSQPAQFLTELLDRVRPLATRERV